VIDALGADGVEARSYYKPALHHQDLFAKCELAGRSALPVTDRLCESILSLPMSDRMTDADVERVVGLVLAHLA
jgi:dTDP-4-amino-4,6-dideoxygalactose transaminase